MKSGLEISILKKCQIDREQHLTLESCLEAIRVLLPLLLSSVQQLLGRAFSPN